MVYLHRGTQIPREAAWRQRQAVPRRERSMQHAACPPGAASWRTTPPSPPAVVDDKDEGVGLVAQHGGQLLGVGGQAGGEQLARCTAARAMRRQHAGCQRQAAAAPSGPSRPALPLHSPAPPPAETRRRCRPARGGRRARPPAPAPAWHPLTSRWILQGAPRQAPGLTAWLHAWQWGGMGRHGLLVGGRYCSPYCWLQSYCAPSGRRSFCRHAGDARSAGACEAFGHVPPASAAARISQQAGAPGS